MEPHGGGEKKANKKDPHDGTRISLIEVKFQDGSPDRAEQRRQSIGAASREEDNRYTPTIISSPKQAEKEKGRWIQKGYAPRRSERERESADIATQVPMNLKMSCLHA